jgi:TonB family protein
VDAVTQILLDRSRDVDAISRTVVVSLAAHALLIAAILYLPGRFASQPDNVHIMTISLAGAAGPVQGHNPESAKAVQQVAPPSVKPQPEAPPALAKPEMVEPIKKAPPQSKAVVKPEPQKETQQLHGRTPTQGAEVTKGVSRTETKSAAQTQNGGLSTGGGGVPGAYTEYADFCCPEYLESLKRLIYGNWQQHQGMAGANTVKFTIRRDGTITDVAIEQTSNQYLNLASLRAMQATQKLPPLPAAFSGDHLTIHLEFDYLR